MTEPDTTTERVDYALRRRERAAERSMARRKRVPVAAILGGVAVILVLCAVDAAASWGRVHPGVHVAGVSVGGMRPDAASEALEAAFPAKVEAPIRMTHDDKSWEISAADIGLSFDYDAMVDDAMAVGREPHVLVALAGRLGAWVGASDLPARPEADPTRLTSVLDLVAKDTDVAPSDATVKVEGVTLAVVPGEDGQGLDREQAEARMLTAILSTDRVVAAPVVTVDVAVTDDEAQAARATAEIMLGAPAHVTHSDKKWDFAPSDVAAWIAFRRSDEPLEGSPEETGNAAPSAEVTLVAYVSPVRVKAEVIPAIGAKVGRPAKNASFSTSSGRVTIIASQEGIGPDVDLLASELTSELADTASDRTVELRTTRVEPALTTAEAREMGIDNRISRYTTTYDAGNRSRVNNIHLLGDALDGKLIRPGATFSFNGAVGERTAAKGYQEANAIVNGKLVPQLGGGICQVGTTLFNTVFESGLPVVERRNHSFYISHYPKGRDATVSWGGPDLKFKNDTENWVLISVSYTASSITIAFYGTDPGYDVDASTSEWRNIKPFPTEQIKDPTMLVGTKIVEDTGVTGRSITVTRTVQKNGAIIRTDTFVSVYKPKIQVVRIGTKPKPVSRPATTTPTP